MSHLDGLALAEKIRNSEVTPTELIEEAFKKIKSENPTLNFVTSTRFSKAIEEAQVRDFSTLPFGGVPILIKGLGQDLAGEPSTAGAKLLRNNSALTTSHFVAALEKAGFIVIGQTNTPEFGFKNITDPELYGPTSNPWNPAYSAGGSSGGAAAAVASGTLPIAAASDGGGSIRIPASFSGLVGLKPTRGKTPVGPGTGRNWQGAAISFALTTSIRDTAAMLDALQVIEPSAAFQASLYEPGYLTSLGTLAKKKFRIAYSLASPVHTPVSTAAKNAVLDAVTFLKAQGHHVVEKEPDIDGIALMESYYVMNAGETAAMFKNLEKQLARSLTITDMELMTWTLFNAGKHISAADYSNSLALWDQAAEKMAAFNQEYDLYLTPTTATTAPKIAAELQTPEQIQQMKQVEKLSSTEQMQLVWDMFEKSLALSPFTQQANLTGQPAISLPTHIAENGLPLGIHFTAPKNREEWLLEIGLEFEQNGQFKLRE